MAILKLMFCLCLQSEGVWLPSIHLEVLGSALSLCLHSFLKLTISLGDQLREQSGVTTKMKALDTHPALLRVWHWEREEKPWIISSETFIRICQGSLININGTRPYYSNRPYSSSPLVIPSCSSVKSDHLSVVSLGPSSCLVFSPFSSPTVFCLPSMSLFSWL